MRHKEKHDQEYMKQQNRRLVLNLIKSKRPISRAEIAKITHMSPTSVSRIVSELSERGLVKETELFSNGVGRKALMLDIAANSVLTLGVYLDKDVLEIGLVDFEGRVVSKETIGASAVAPGEIVALIVAAVQRILATNQIDMATICGMGIGMPGIIDFEHGKVIFSAQMGWSNVEFVKQIRAQLDLKITIDNEVKLRALAESLYGAAQSSQNAILISLGSGVGSAFIINGEIFRGKTNIAGEIGHTTVDPYGILCDCGRRGCLQTYIAEGALIQEANKVRYVANLRQIIDAANHKESWAASILDRASLYAAIAINNAVCMYSPDTIILSGRLVEKYPEMVALIEQKCDQYIWDYFKGTFQIVYSVLGEDSEVIGAGTLAANTFFDLGL